MPSAKITKTSSKAARIVLWASSLAVFVWSVPCVAQPQPYRLSDRWVSISSSEFESFRGVFAPYDIHSRRDDIFVLSLTSIRIFRIETDDFCKDGLCLTIVFSACGKPSCPSTSLIAGKEVRLDRLIVPFFGGSQFLVFPRSKDRDMIVLVTKRFVSAWRGFGED